MRSFSFNESSSILSLAVIISTLLFSSPVAFATEIKYPSTDKGDVVDDYNGVKVADPYRWLEDANSGKTAAWVKSENEVTAAFLSKIAARPNIKTRL